MAKYNPSGPDEEVLVLSLQERINLLEDLLEEENRVLKVRLMALELDGDFQTNEIAAMREEILRLRREKDLAVEKVFNLGADCQRKDELNATLAGKNQQLSKKLSDCEYDHYQQRFVVGMVYAQINLRTDELMASEKENFKLKGENEALKLSAETLQKQISVLERMAGDTTGTIYF